MNEKINIIERFLCITDKYNLKTIFKSLFILLLVCATFAFIANPFYLFEKYEEWQKKQHDKEMELRIENNEKLHLLIEKIMYKTNSDRVMLMELHNSGSNIANLPFVKLSCIYESLNDSILPLSQEYQQQQLSLFPFSSYLFKHKYFYGNTEDLLNIDKGLYYKFKLHNINHFACYVVEGIDKPLAFLFVGYEHLNTNHDCKKVKSIIVEESIKMSLLLELNERI